MRLFFSRYVIPIQTVTTSMCISFVAQSCFFYSSLSAVSLVSFCLSFFLFHSFQFRFIAIARCLVPVMFPIDKDDRSNYNTNYGHIICIFVLSLSILMRFCSYFCFVGRRTVVVIWENFRWIFSFLSDLFFIWFGRIYFPIFSYSAIAIGRTQRNEIYICFYLLIKMFRISKLTKNSNERQRTERINKSEYCP